MPKGYHHLTRDQRCQLHALKDSGESIPNIAIQLGVHTSTLYRELRRNTGLKGYKYREAQARALERKNTSTKNRLKMTPDLIAIIEGRLKTQWSPEQVAGWLQRHQGLRAVSHETIYKYVWQNKQAGGLLYKELRHHGKKYNKRSSGKAGRGCIP